MVLYITAESKQQVSNKKLIMVIGIVVLLTVITFISIALYSDADTGDVDSNSNHDEECEDVDSGGGWGACLIQDIPTYINFKNDWL